MQLLELMKQPALRSVEPGSRYFVRSWFRGRRGLVLAGLAIAAVGSALSWHWLTAVGAVPLILSLAPCAAMCVLGVRMALRVGSPRPKPNSVEKDSSGRVLGG